MQGVGSLRLPLLNRPCLVALVFGDVLWVRTVDRGGGWRMEVSGRGRVGPEEEADVEVGGAFADDFLYALTVAPPVSSIVVGIGHGNDPDFEIVAQCFLEKEPGTAGVDAFGEDVDAGDGGIVLAEPIPECEGRAVGSIPILDEGRDHLHAVSGNTRRFQSTRSYGGGGAVDIAWFSPMNRTSRSEGPAICTISELMGCSSDYIFRNPAFHDQNICLNTVRSSEEWMNTDDEDNA
jgi:hypothetical protein